MQIVDGDYSVRVGVNYATLALPIVYTNTITIDTAAPPPVTNLEFTEGQNAGGSDPEEPDVLTWAPAVDTSPGGYHYLVYRSLDPITSTAVLKPITSTVGTASSYAFPHVSNSYYYAVVTEDAAGNRSSPDDGGGGGGGGGGTLPPPQVGSEAGKVDVILIIDDSWSMDAGVLQAGVNGNIDLVNRLEEKDRIGIRNIAGDKPGMPLTLLDGATRTQATTAIAAYSTPSNGSPLNEALLWALDEFTRPEIANNGRPHAIVVFSDGEASVNGITRALLFAQHISVFAVTTPASAYGYELMQSLVTTTTGQLESQFFGNLAVADNYRTIADAFRGQAMKQINGDLPPNTTQDILYYVDAQTQQVSLRITWNPSGIAPRITLKDPNGTVYTQQTSSAVAYSEKEGEATFTLLPPINAGRWTIRLENTGSSRPQRLTPNNIDDVTPAPLPDARRDRSAVEDIIPAPEAMVAPFPAQSGPDLQQRTLTSGNIPFTIEPRISSPVTTSMTLDAANRTLLVAAFDSGQPLTDTTAVWVELQHSSGITNTIIVYDDGQHGDAASDDGHFGGNISTIPINGIYRATVTMRHHSEQRGYLERVTERELYLEGTPNVRLESAAMAVEERTPQPGVTVILNPPQAQAVTVQYMSTAGTATAGSDYQPISGTLRFAPGVTSQTIPLTITDDIVGEDDETFGIALFNPVNVPLIALAKTSVTIKSNDRVAFVTPTVAVDEGSSLFLPVRLNAPAARIVTVDYTVTGGSATAGSDFFATGGTLTFYPNQIEQSIPASPHNDTLYEADETFTVTLSNPTNIELMAPSTMTVTINMNDEVRITPYNQIFVDENDGLVGIPIYLPEARPITVTVGYATGSYTAVDAATAGSDYTPISGTLTFPPATTVQTITLPILEDGLAEPRERFSLRLTQASNITFSPQPVPVYINANDTLQFMFAAITANEVYPKAMVYLTLNAPSAQPITVTYQTLDGTALAGQDYVAQLATITFEPGITYKYFDFPIMNDSTTEGEETFSVVLSNPVNAELGTTTTQTVRIVADNLPTPTPTTVPTATPLPTNSVLFVTGTTATSSDTAVINRLKDITVNGTKLNVIVKTHTTVTAADAGNGVRLVLISSSVASTSVGTTFKTTPVPVIVWEYGLFDDMGMSGTSSGPNFGETGLITQLTISQPSHPLAAGLSGTVTVHTTAQRMAYGSGLPASAITVAHVPGTSGRSLIWGYESGAAMVGLNAPARRVGLFFHDASGSNATPQGWQLFDAAVLWALGSGGAPSPTPTSIATATATATAPATSVPPTATGSPIPTATATSVPPTSTATTTLPTVTPTPGGAAKTALFVVHNEGALNAGDTAVRNRLVGLNYTVTVKSASPSTASDATGKTLVLISSSVSSGDVAAKFKSVLVPVITWEYAIYDDLALTGTSATTDYGTAASSSLVISNAGHPLAGGLSGTVAVFSAAASMPYGAPSANAISLAPQGTSNSKKVYFAYEKNAVIAGGFSVNARRVGLFWVDTATPTNDAWTLFEAAVNWATMP